MSLKRLLLVFCVVSCLVLVSCMESSYVEPPPGIPRLRTPTIWIEEHDITVNGKNIVRISSSVEGAEIYYSTDMLNNITPNKNSTLYYADAGIPVNDKTRVRAVVVKEGYRDSEFAQKWFYKVDKPGLVVNSKDLKIISTATHVYYAEDSTEKDPKEMALSSPGAIIVPSLKSESGINYTVVVGENGFINSVLEKSVRQAKRPTISDSIPVIGNSYQKQILLNSNGDYASFTTNGTDPSRSNGKSFSGLYFYKYFYTDTPKVKVISFASGVLSSDIVSRDF